MADRTRGRPLRSSMERSDHRLSCGAKNKAANQGVEVFSMDDEAVYGPELHRLPFSKVVE